MTNATEVTQTVATEYNGWSNRETWVVNLWLTGNECYYAQMCEIIKSFDTLADQAEELEQYVSYLTSDCSGIGIVADLLAASLARVNWVEIVMGNR